MASRRVLPEDLPALVSFSQPLYHGQLEELSIMLSPLNPEIGTKATVFGLYPTFLMKLEVSLVIPASNSPVPAAMMRIAQSAWEVPVIMFLMKSTVTRGINDGDVVLWGL